MKFTSILLLIVFAVPFKVMGHTNERRREQYREYKALARHYQEEYSSKREESAELNYAEAVCSSKRLVVFKPLSDRIIALINLVNSYYQYISLIPKGALPAELQGHISKTHAGVVKLFKGIYKAIPDISTFKKVEKMSSMDTLEIFQEKMSKFEESYNQHFPKNSPLRLKSCKSVCFR